MCTACLRRNVEKAAAAGIKTKKAAVKQTPKQPREYEDIENDCWIKGADSFEKPRRAEPPHQKQTDFRFQAGRSPNMHEPEAHVRRGGRELTGWEDGRLPPGTPPLSALRPSSHCSPPPCSLQVNRRKEEERRL